MRATHRLQFRGKLVLAFILAVSPLPFLSAYSLRARLSDQAQTFLVTQRAASQAVAISLETTFEQLTDTAWMLAGDPLVRVMDPQELDSYLASKVRTNPLLLGIAVFDESGQNRGWGFPMVPANPRLDISASEVFQRALATNNTAVGSLSALGWLPTRGVEIGVPIRDPQGFPKGLLVLSVSRREMARLYEGVRRQAGQVIFAYDRNGILIFQTAKPDFLAEEQAPGRGPLQAPVQDRFLEKALAGIPADFTHFMSPVTHEASIGSLTPVRRLGWVAGASISRQVALTGAYNEFYRNVIGQLLVLGLSCAMAYLLARLIARPITQLKAQAQQIGEGNLSARSHISTHDEFHDLAEVFNETAARLECREAELSRALAKEKEARSAAEHATRVREDFLSIASHELKTPITPLSMRIDLLTHLVENQSLSAVSEQKLRNVLLGFRHDLDRLVALINDLLDVSQIEAGRLTAHFSEMELSEQVDSSLTRLASLFPSQVIEKHLEKGIFCVTDAMRLDQILTNLITNAVKYGKGNPITVSLAQRSDTILLGVRDRGIGIARQDQKRIFQKFERAVSQRSFGGLGLGLYITCRLADLLGGAIRVESEFGQGAHFIVELPKQPAQGTAKKLLGDEELQRAR
jgi:signal transduction histidine kinase